MIALRLGSASSPAARFLCYNESPAQAWALNSAVECHLHTVEVIGSNPIAPTILPLFSLRRHFGAGQGTGRKVFRSGSISMKLTHYRVSAPSDSLANRGPSPGLESWVSEANQQTFMAVAMNPRLGQWVIFRPNLPTTNVFWLRDSSFVV